MKNYIFLMLGCTHFYGACMSIDQRWPNYSEQQMQDKKNVFTLTIVQKYEHSELYISDSMIQLMKDNNIDSTIIQRAEKHNLKKNLYGCSPPTLLH